MRPTLKLISREGTHSNGPLCKQINHCQTVCSDAATTLSEPSITQDQWYD